MATPNDKYERRLIEVRAIGDGDKMTIEGYAIVFEQPATHNGFTEVIKRGALDGADMSNVPLRYNHLDSIIVIARTKNGSLRLIVDNHGLLIQADLLDTQSNRDIYASIQAGLIDKMSFAFVVAPNGDTWSFGEKETTREVTKIEKLYDVSVVDAPFYEGTSIYARSLELLDDNKRQVDAAREREIALLKEKIRLKGSI